ncbi:MAG: hypothetical protein Kow0031_00070 [Anaerolineae bacterium]
MKINHFFVAIIFALVAGVIGLLLSAGTARAVTCNVPAGYATVQAALDDSSCDTIVIAAGTFSENLVIRRSVAIEGAGTSLDASTTRLRAGGGFPDRVVYIPYRPVDEAVVSISNLNIEDGTTTGAIYGAGIFNGETLTLDNVIVTASTANRGGGLYASDYATTTILNSRILVNSVPTVGSAVGSNIHNDAISGTMTISNSIIGNGLNSKYDIETNGPTVIYSSTITGGTTGIFASAVLTLENSTVSGNGEYGLDLDNLTSPYTVVITGSNIKNSALDGIRAVRDVQLTVNNTTVSGNGGYGIQILKIGETTPVLTVTNSLIQDNGGGVATGGDTLIQNTQIYTSTGGGIVHRYGDLTVKQSDIRYHTSNNPCGGGIQAGNSTTAFIQESIIAFNQATNGGGICMAQGAAVTVERSTMGGNVALKNGGGVYAGYLGTGSGTLKLVNSTITLNESNDNGGGIYAASGVLTVTNVTVARNTADADTSNGGLGGGYYADVPAPVTSTLVNSLLALNSLGNSDPADCSGTVTSGGTNLVGVADGCSGFITSDITGTTGSPLDAQLGSLKNNGGNTPTIALGPTSPAVDAGQDSVCNASPVSGLDQRHYGRVNVDGNGDGGVDGDSCDIGAFERGGVYAEPVTPGYFSFLPLIVK